jgi:hypothetical protein
MSKTLFKGDLENQASACILIASHISSEKRIAYLIETLESFMKQTLLIPVYLSVSFESEELNTSFLQRFAKTPDDFRTVIVLYINSLKTPQMRHMASLFPLIQKRYNWVMFSDDDDIYQPNRVEHFLVNIDRILSQANINKEFTGKEFTGKEFTGKEFTGKEFAGIYENQIGEEHTTRRHEYWCYCVRTRLLGRFFATVEQYPEILDNKCCDVLFAEFLRRLDQGKYFFAVLTDKYYHYRTENNEDSVTGMIQTSQKVIRPAREVTPENHQECIAELSEYLDSNVSVYLHDTFLYSVVGMDFDGILQKEFKSEYPIISEINQGPIQEMRTLHEKLRNVCNLMFDIKI